MVRPDKIHGQTTDQVAEVLWSNHVWDDHERKEGNACRENQAVDKNDEASLLQITQLGVFDFAVDLCQSFLAAHSQDGVPQTNENANKPNGVWQARVAQPAERIVGESQISRRNPGRPMRTPRPNGEERPSGHHDHHNGSHIHDLQSFPARFRNAFDVFPPKIEGHQEREYGRSKIHRKSDVPVDGLEEVVQESRQILTSGDTADWAGENV